MKNYNVQKINSIGKGSRIVISIITAVVSIAAVVAFVLSILLFVFFDDNDVDFSGKFSGKLTVNTDGNIHLVDDIETKGKSVSRFVNELEYSVEKDKEADGSEQYDVEVSLGGINFGNIRNFGAVFLIISGVSSIFICIALVFARKFAAALEKCESPFEEDVMKKMSNFGVSLIPCAALKIIIHGVFDLSAILLILIVIMLINIFKYGAQLQKESDETL